MIEVRGVDKRYGKHVVVDGISLTLLGSGMTAIIGPNGAGKSTLLSMISRLSKVDSGSIRVDGLDVATTSGDVLARKLAILRQNNQIGTRLSVHDLVMFGRYPHSRGRPTPLDHQQVAQALAYMNLSDLAGRFLDELSGGQRQRAFVAMVLCQDTDYLLLDEPLNSLDMNSAVAMMKRLRRAADELGKSIIMVLHDINYASCYCDQIIAMRAGQVICQGPPQDVIEQGMLRKIYDMEIPIHHVDGQRIALYFT
ncbi:iron ABC transporter ATP-binding protein [Pseudomonas sp. LRF_L74]|uniref:iron ABC transporter ATP-binding protein n=1 Tax=Pseudomonas sp. LRF_L74 TaxID=3369422 RepID=UPI003F627A9E